VPDLQSSGIVAPPVAAAPIRAGARRVRRQRMVALIALGSALCLLPFVLNNYLQFVVNTMLVYCLVAVGFNVVIGYLGQLAFANAAFFGIGAYATGLSMVHFGLPFPAAMVVGTAAGGLAGGLTAVRVSSGRTFGIR